LRHLDFAPSVAQFDRPPDAFVVQDLTKPSEDGEAMVLEASSTAPNSDEDHMTDIVED